MHSHQIRRGGNTKREVNLTACETQEMGKGSQAMFPLSCTTMQLEIEAIGALLSKKSPKIIAVQLVLVRRARG